MTEFLKRLWLCVILDDHDWRCHYVYTHQIPSGRVPKGREYRYQGESTNPQEIAIYICDRLRCHAIGFPLTGRGEKP